MGKKLSLIAKCVALVFAVVMFKWSTRSAVEIALITGVIAEIFMSVDISMIKKAGQK